MWCVLAIGSAVFAAAFFCLILDCQAAWEVKVKLTYFAKEWTNTMKKLFSLVLCLCMALSLTGAVAEEWDAAYDVVVIGFGGAGASAAIEAADAGAKVLVLEKAPATAAGGNTKLSGQQVLSPTDVEIAVEYLPLPWISPSSRALSNFFSMMEFSP